VLLLPAPGEQHMFGLSVVAEFFRRAGWDVRGGVADPDFDPLAALRAEWVDVIGVSVACQSHLVDLEPWIARLRRTSRNRGIGVMVGGPAIAGREALVPEMGADATAPDGRSAPAVAEKLLSSRSMRL
jgi:methylmalonyl-CoA mutase cobalamin-binding subunit